MVFLDLFIVALIPILKTLIVTAVGLILAFEKINILNETARHHLNNLVFFVFTPALIASSLANTITVTSLVKLWFMPVNILLTFMIGSALSWISKSQKLFSICMVLLLAPVLQAYASFSMAIGAVFIWTCVYNIIRGCAMKSKDSTRSIHSGISENSSGLSRKGSAEALLSFKDEEIHGVEDPLLQLNKDNADDGHGDDDKDDQTIFGSPIVK